MNGQVLFTGFGTGAPAPKGGLTPGKVLFYGTVAQAGWELGNWLAYQHARFENWRAERAALDDLRAAAEADNDAATVMFMAWDALVDLRNWLATDAGPVESWDGDLSVNIQVAQYIERLFPEVFNSWRSRNYGGRQVDSGWRDQLIAAITSLGWSHNQAARAADQVQREAHPGSSLSELLKQALANLLRASQGGDG